MTSYENSKLALQRVNLNDSLSTNQIVNTTDGFTLFDQYNFKDTMDVESTSTINNKTAKYLIGVAKIVGDKGLIKKYERLSKDQDKAGSLTGPLQKTRQQLDKELLSKAFDEIGNARELMRAL